MLVPDLVIGSNYQLPNSCFFLFIGVHACMHACVYVHRVYMSMWVHVLMYGYAEARERHWMCSAIH